MKYSHLLKCIEETSLSPEELAPIWDVSNMTLRRWKTRPKNSSIAKSLEPAIREGIYKLLIQGHLKATSYNVEKLLEGSHSNSFEACIKSMGVDDTLLKEAAVDNEESLALVLAKIGHGKEYRDEVDAKQTEISKFKSFGKTWSSHLSTLLGVIRSSKLALLDKVVAYGALFYLIYPFDLIPDSIPVIGYLDDFAMIAVAVAYYAKRYPYLFGPAAKKLSYKSAI